MKIEYLISVGNNISDGDTFLNVQRFPEFLQTISKEVFVVNFYNFYNVAASIICE